MKLPIDFRRHQGLYPLAHLDVLGACNAREDLVPVRVDLEADVLTLEAHVLGDLLDWRAGCARGLRRRRSKQVWTQIEASHVAIRGGFNCHTPFCSDGFPTEPLRNAPLCHPNAPSELGLGYPGLNQVFGELHDGQH